MQIGKRILSFILVLTLLLGTVPALVQAGEQEATVEANSTTVTGTNSFGSLLSSELAEEQEEEQAATASGYNVIGLTVTDGIAAAEYCSLEEAVLAVAIYTEDGMQMLLSGHTLVQPEDTTAEVVLEGEMPEYFMASAFLLDIYDYSPLCDAYDTPMYTREMVELMASTVNDYDADRVLNLDESETTNFAVYTEDVKIIPYTEGVNTVITADDDSATYVFANADAQMTGLQVGDIFSYTYGEDQLLIVCVASVQVDGTTVTVTGGDLEIEDVFTHLKLESAGDSTDMTVDTSDLEEGVVFEGLTSDSESEISTYAFDGESSWKNQFG